MGTNKRKYKYFGTQKHCKHQKIIFIGQHEQYTFLSGVTISWEKTLVHFYMTPNPSDGPYNYLGGLTECRGRKK